MQTSQLTAQNVDDLGRMLLALLSEVWIIRDRMTILERMLADKVGLTSIEIDDYLPDPALAAELERLRDRLVGAVISAPVAPRDNAVEAILARAGFATQDRASLEPGSP